MINMRLFFIQNGIYAFRENIYYIYIYIYELEKDTHCIEISKYIKKSVFNCK